MASAERRFSRVIAPATCRTRCPTGFADRSTIVEQLLERLVFADALILLERRDQPIERLDGNGVTLDRFRKERSSRGASFRPGTSPEVRRATKKEFKRPLTIADFVAQVIGPTAESIDTLKRWPILARSQPGHDTKILVVPRRQIARSTRATRHARADARHPGPNRRRSSENTMRLRFFSHRGTDNCGSIGCIVSHDQGA